MVPHAECRRKKLLLLLLLISITTITAQAKADYILPSPTDWYGSGKASGIFATGKIAINITSGEQFAPSSPQIKFRSNTSQPIDLGICVADFRLLRIESNGSLTQADYTHYTLSSIDTANGVFWASTIYDYPSNYRIGVVIWNATDGSVVGRLMATIHTRASPPPVSYVSLTTDKTDYVYFADIHVTLATTGPIITFNPDVGDFSVYRLVCGEWKSVDKEHIVTCLEASLLKGGSRSWTLNRLIMDVSQPGDYMVEKFVNCGYGIENQRVSTVFRIHSIPYFEPVDLFACASVRMYSIVAGALIGAVCGFVIFYVIRIRGKSGAHTRTSKILSSLHANSIQMIDDDRCSVFKECIVHR